MYAPDLLLVILSNRLVSFQSLTLVEERQHDDDSGQRLTRKMSEQYGRPQ